MAQATAPVLYSTYPAAEKLEIIQLVEHPICRFGGRWSRSESQDPRSIDGAIFIQTGGPEALDDRSPRPDGCGTASPMTSAPDRHIGTRRARALAS